MGLADTLPDRPLREEEFEKIIEELPEGYNIRPGSTIPVNPNLIVIPTISIADVGNEVTLYGFDPDVDSWVTIETWDVDEFESEIQVETVQEFVDERYPEAPIDGLIDL